MSRISAYSISLLLLLSCSLIRVHAQDTILIPLKIRIGLELSGPIIYYTDKNILNTEGNVSVDLDEKKSFIVAAGYLDYSYSQYNYTYLNNGFFIRTGIDFNLLKPDKALGKYWAGIGLRYGLSRFNSEVPIYEKGNYWGTTTAAIAKQTNWGHFFEISPGVRAEIFHNISIGWSVSLRFLLHTNTGKDLKPIYFPGFGNGTKTLSTGISYFIVWNIPYKKIKAVIKKEAPEEPEDKGDTGTTGTKQQGTGIRQ
jgi:hypothetical protein